MDSLGPFKVLAKDRDSHARCGILETHRGRVETPVFMPVGTQGSVKGIWPEQLEQIGARIVLGNTYHLALRPGEDLVKKFGGLHKFSAWSGPMLTDSGGFQVFSLKNIRKLNEEGVEFRSHIDGSALKLTPETSMEIQNKLGADIIMAFDECPELPCEDKVMADSIERTGRWLKRCVDAHQRKDVQHLFGIVQGGLSPELRLRSLELTEECDLPGLAIGGLSVGETADERNRVLQALAGKFPEHKPHYLMGVGTPLDMVEAIACGVDMFDCVLPTREGRHGVAYTSKGKVRIKNQKYKEDEAPLDENCECPTCQKYSKAYLRHLFVAGEMLAQMALSLHNLAYFIKLMKDIREAIPAGNFMQLKKNLEDIYQEEQRR